MKRQDLLRHIESIQDIKTLKLIIKAALADLDKAEANCRE